MVEPSTEPVHLLTPLSTTGAADSSVLALASGYVEAQKGPTTDYARPYRSIPCGSWITLPPSTTSDWPVT
jgi:hypothetical protein